MENGLMMMTMVDQILKELDYCLSQIKWRLKPSSNRRLHTDVLALCSGMRPVVMVDYGGKMPELQVQLCALIELLHKDSTNFKQLRVMVIEDMIYLVNVTEFAEYITQSLNLDAKLCFVDLEQDPPKMISAADESSAAKELVSVEHLFSSVFTANGVDNDALQGLSKSCKDEAKCSSSMSSQISEVLDLTSCLLDSEITIPTLNGWLLGYPVVYLFGKQHISDAIYNLSTKPLHLFSVLVHRNTSHNRTLPPEELLSFSVPYELSMDGHDESWAKAFKLQMEAKWEKCKPVWGSLQMEVTHCYPQAIAL